MAEVKYPDLDITQAFNYAKDVQNAVGHLTKLKIGDTELSADLTFTKPTDDLTYSVVGAIATIEWAGGHGDPMKLDLLVTTKNKQKIATLLHKELSKTDVLIQFKVYEYDPVAKVWYISFMAASNAVLEGLLLKDSGKLDLTIPETKPNDTIKSPENWKIHIGVAPWPKQQDLQYATANGQNVVKKWGITVSGK